MRFPFLDWIGLYTLEKSCEKAFETLFSKYGFHKVAYYKKDFEEHASYSNGKVALMFVYDNAYVSVLILKLGAGDENLADVRTFGNETRSVWLPGYIMLKGGKEPEFSDLEALSRRDLPRTLAAFAAVLDRYCQPLFEGHFEFEAESWILKNQYDRKFFPSLYK